MLHHRSRARLALLYASVVLGAVLWLVWLRPVALGGTSTYVIVQGESMQPTYESGDLVLIRESDEYTVGDVIAFRGGSPTGDTRQIIHRIVGETEGGSFQTQGDNRDELDPWTPEPDHVLGRAVLHIPMAGQAAQVLSRPVSLAAIGGAAMLIGGQQRRRRRNRPRSHSLEEPATMSHEMTHQPGEAVASSVGAPSRFARVTHPRWAFIGLIVSVLLAIPVMAVSWSALRAPDSVQRIETVGQVDVGIGFDYRFTGRPSTVYPTGEVKTTRSAAGALVADGPLYSRLLDDLGVELAFRSAVDGSDSASSTYSVDVAVETPSGWSTTIQSIEPTPFDGTATEEVAIDLRAVASKVTAVAGLTGVGGDAYTITVLPSLDVSGATEAGQVQHQLAAPMTFAVEDNVITASAIEAAEREDLTRTVNDRATYSVGPFDMGTQAARGLLGGLSLVLTAGIVWFASVLFGGVGLSEPERIAARYRSQIIDVAEAAAPPGPVVMVSAIDELARIARLEQTVMLHEDLGDGAHRYRVFLGTVTYEFETAPEHAGGAAEETTAGVDETGG
ncbi:MAG: signal peptidase I [Acidimicrobiales bacterium]